MIDIESLDGEGRGVAHVEGKAVFVEGALPGERVAIETLKRKPTYDVARTAAIGRAAADRTTPRCPHFGMCGGCSLQHASPALQVAAKQRVLEEALKRIGRVTPDCLLPAVHGPTWQYRHRARFSVRDVPRKGGVLVGFHERRSSYVADMRECHVVPGKISNLLPELRSLVASLSIARRIPQIELAIGERPRSDDPVVVLVFRVLETPTMDDRSTLRAFAQAHRVDVWLQPGGPATAAPLHPADSTLGYSLPEFDVFIAFGPTDFTQVNPAMNRALVRRAMMLLNPSAGERIADFFCGLGNFTLPIARFGAHVVGVEGVAGLVDSARRNAAAHDLEANTRFVVANLFGVTREALKAWLPLDKAVIDPPREGAIELVRSLPAADEPSALEHLVYVSCNAATLARDAGVLVHDRGYRLEAAGVFNMFPHTAHVESIARFVR
ncbi:MAG TPA: 23S rRNA (uracil(1939)-C(5))-methyltransferase RlmD [Casimicrobiaceae bacterium]|nr:23S rRNA (uracil(1939)-C(5))-methyltransferase RlmD [Casimicrobiaceae bacterium]